MKSLNMELGTWEYGDVTVVRNVDTQDKLEAKMIEELEKLKQHGVYEETTEEGQDVIQSSWIISEYWKKGSKRTDARLVVKGFPEENQGNMRKDSPTCLKTGLRLALSTGVSTKWIVKELDIKSAFLQGHQIEQDVFLEASKETRRKML